MEDLKLPNAKQAWQNVSILIMLLRDWIKNQVSDIASDLSINDLILLLKENSTLDNTLKLLFSEVRDTIIPNIKIWKSKIDWKDYFINIEENSVSDIWFDEIVELIQKDWKIIFQACDYFIDGYYAFYDFNTWKIISKKSDKRQYTFNSLLN